MGVQSFRDGDKLIPTDRDVLLYHVYDVHVRGKLPVFLSPANGLSSIPDNWVRRCLGMITIQLALGCVHSGEVEKWGSPLKGHVFLHWFPREVISLYIINNIV